MEPEGFRLFLLVTNNTTKKRTLTMKRMMKIGVASLTLLASATMLRADEDFDNLKILAATPKEQLTAENAMKVIDAGIAVTNYASIYNAADLKLVSFADIFAKTKGNLQLAWTQCYVAVNYGTDAEKVEALNDAVDVFITSDEKGQQQLYCTLILYSVWNHKNGGIMSKINNVAFTAAIEKLAASDAKWKWSVVNGMLFVWGRMNFGNNEALAAKYTPSIINALKTGDFIVNQQVFDFVAYLCSIGDYHSAKVILGNPKWFSKSRDRDNVSFLTNQSKNLEPELSISRKEFISKIATNERGMINVARVQDKVDGNKDATAKLCWPRLKNNANKIEVALYLNDTDKLLDILVSIDNTLDADTISKAITIINSLDPDYRAADVLKALRVINKKYTLKLYDDRDTWEPILSKVRALIDTYNN